MHGERLRDFLVVPPATVTPTRDAVMLTNGAAAPVLVRVRAAADALSGEVELQLPPGEPSLPRQEGVGSVVSSSESSRSAGRISGATVAAASGANLP